MSGTLSSWINQSANKYGVPPKLVKAVATQESSLGQTSNNVMQVNGMDGSGPQASIDKGSQMLAQYMKQTGGNVEWSLAMYNMGSGILPWAKQQGITNPRQAMQAFSRAMVQRGYSGGYGDPNYIDHVEQYLN